MQMQNEKIENILNLALEMPEEERRRTMDLNVGYEKEDRSWTVIVRYSDSLLPYTSELVRVNELTGGYAIVQLPESLIPKFCSASGSRIYGEASPVVLLSGSQHLAFLRDADQRWRPDGNGDTGSRD